MREIQIDCPYCGTLQGAKVICVAVSAPFNGDVFCTCNRCLRAVLLVVRMRSSYSSAQTILAQNLPDDLWGVGDVKTYPNLKEPRLVDCLPGSVASAFRDGEDEMLTRKFRSAVGSYRTALERALRQIDPELEDKLSQGGTKRVSLNNKIQAIQKDKLLPQGLIELANRIRWFGNEIHEDEDPGEDQALLASDCAHLLLLYLFELPAKLNAAQHLQSSPK